MIMHGKELGTWTMIKQMKNFGFGDEMKRQLSF